MATTGNASEDGLPPASLRRAQIYALVAVLVVLSNVPLGVLIWLWPSQDELAGDHPLPYTGFPVISPEQRILLCVAFCGLLGGSIRMLLRIRHDFTSRTVTARYIPWYFLTPPMGAILAMGFYFVVRGGFLASGTTAQNVNIFAFGGTGVLVGIFAEAAISRLEGAFSGAFDSREAAEKPERDDSA